MKRYVAVLIITALFIACSSCAAAQAEEQPAPTVPQVRVVTENGSGTSLQKSDGYVNATVTITDTDGSVLSDSALFKVRGNSTAMAHVTKKAFTFKFDKKKDVLGMGKEKKWALLANAFDPTMMRNYIALDLAQRMGLSYTSQQRYVELWVDGSFRGCYVLTEPVQEGKERVDIDIESDGGMKDFMIEREATRIESDVTYFTTHGIRFAISEPEEPTAEQLAYIKGTMDDIMTTARSGSRAAIEEKIDIPSFTRYYLLNELLKTVDFDYSSVFFYYKDGVLYAGPAWDYDLSAGNSNRIISSNSAAAFSTQDEYAAKMHLYRYLCSYSWFKEEVRRTYLMYYDDFTDIYSEGGLMDRLLADYAEVFGRNFTTAGWKPGTMWVNVQRMPDATFEKNVEFLRGWLRERGEWLREYMGVYLVGDADGDFAITILDVTRIQRLLASYTVEDEERSAIRGETTEDELSILDATYIQRYLADIAVDVPIGGKRLYQQPDPVKPPVAAD